jgi:hypothetical protein
MTTALKSTISIKDVRIGASKLTIHLKWIVRILSAVIAIYVFYFTYNTSIVLSTITSKIIFSFFEACLSYLAAYLILGMIFGEIRSLFISSKKQYLKELNAQNNEAIYLIRFVLDKENNQEGFQNIVSRTEEFKKTYPTAFNNVVYEPEKIKSYLLGKYFSTVSKLLEMSEKIGIKPEAKIIASELDEAMKNIEADIDCGAGKVCDFAELHSSVQRLKIELANQLSLRKLIAQQILDFKLT